MNLAGLGDHLADGIAGCLLNLQLLTLEQPLQQSGELMSAEQTFFEVGLMSLLEGLQLADQPIHKAVGVFLLLGHVSWQPV